METKVIDPKIFAFVELTTTHNRIHNDVEKVMPAFMEEAQQLEISGPMEFVYFDATEDKDKEYQLRIAYPVKEEKQLKGITFENGGIFQCLTHELKGAISGLGEAYHKVFDEIFAKQLKPSNQIREVYHQFTTMEADDNFTEIQIGLN